MKKVGDYLRNSRQERQISLREVGDSTKIQLHYLEALEEGDFDKFSGEVYLKGALRSYAESIGLDPGEVLELYLSRKGETAPPEVPFAPREKPAAPPRIPRMEKGPSFMYGLALVILLLAAGGYWLASRDSRNSFEQHDPAAQTGPGEEGKTALPDEGKEDGAENEPAAARAVVELSPAESTAGETVFKVSHSEKLELKLSSGEPCWVKVLLDGKEHLEPRNLGEGEEMLLEASETIWIRLGNPRSVRLILNGIEVKDMDGKREPHNVLFRRNQDR